MTSTLRSGLIDLDDVGIHYEERGTGDTVLLVHAGLYGDWFAPLLREPGLDGHRVVRTHRAGYGESSRPDRHLTIADHARHCTAVLDDLGVERAWIVGHSSGGIIALQAALDRPDLVAGLVLLEPAPSPSGPEGAELGGRVIGPAMAALGGGDVTGAATIFLDGVCGDHWARLMAERNGDGARAQLASDAAYFFDEEIRAAVEWHLDPDDAATLTRPVLIVHGGRSPERTGAYAETAALLRDMLPAADLVELAGLGHAMPLEDPVTLADLISTTVARGAAHAPRNTVDRHGARLNGFHHVKVPVTDVARSRAWYRRVLDLEVVMDFVEDDVLMGVALSDPAGTLSIALRHDPARAAVLSGFDAMALGVPNRAGVDAWRARLEDLAEPHGGVVTGHRGGSVLVGLHDPDGIEIRLYAD